MLMLQLQTVIQCHKRLKNLFAGINVIMNLYGGARVSERKKASQDKKLDTFRSHKKGERWHWFTNITTL